jgi:hypothetical protein
MGTAGIIKIPPTTDFLGIDIRKYQISAFSKHGAKGIPIHG